jgi:hypothetical protein
MGTRLFLAGVFILMSAWPASAQFDRFLKDLGKGLGIGKPAGLSEEKIVAGLKEALQVGTENAINVTGKMDGYFRNEAIKILIPEKLRNLEKGLRTVGYGSPVDEFVVAMNRAAERAAPQAKEIFWDAIKAMSFDDARKILTGNETAATDYFKEKTTDRLSAAFKPVIDSSMNEGGVARQYKELVGRFQAIPFAKTESFDLDQYVTEKSLAGLFYVLGQEEKKIRTNPAARVTDLLKEVFGK